MAKQTQTHIVQRELPCKMSDADKASVLDDMAAAELGVENLKAEVRELNTKKRALEGHRNGLAHDVEMGTQEREVECLWVEDMAKNVKRLIRQDTQEVVEETALTLDDRMQDLPGTEGNVSSIADAKGAKAGAKKPPKK